jgi:hypothetical protein
MPISIQKTTGGLAHAPVFVGEILATDAVKVDISALSSNEIDANGYLKPGVPFQKSGLLVAADTPVFGVTIEAIKIADGNAAGDISGAVDCFVAVGTHGVINRDIAEDVLGRAYTAAEIAGFALAGSNLHLTRT